MESHFGAIWAELPLSSRLRYFRYSAYGKMKYFALLAVTQASNCAKTLNFGNVQDNPIVLKLNLPNPYNEE